MFVLRYRLCELTPQPKQAHAVFSSVAPNHHRQAQEYVFGHVIFLLGCVKAIQNNHCQYKPKSSSSTQVGSCWTCWHEISLNSSPGVAGFNLRRNSINSSESSRPVHRIGNMTLSVSNSSKISIYRCKSYLSDPLYYCWIFWTVQTK